MQEDDARNEMAKRFKVDGMATWCGLIVSIIFCMALFIIINILERLLKLNNKVRVF